MGEQYTKVQKIRIYPNKKFQESFLKLFRYQAYCYNKSLDISDKLFEKYIEEKTKDSKDSSKYWPTSRRIRDEHKKQRGDWEFVYNQSIVEVQAGEVEKAWQNFRNANMPNHAKPKRKILSKELEKKHKTISLALGDNIGTSFKKQKNGKMILQVPMAKTKNKLVFPPVTLKETFRFKNKIARSLKIVNNGDEWYAIITFKNFAPVETKSKHHTAIDLNIKNFDYLNNKNELKQFQLLSENLEKELKKVKELSRELSIKRKDFFVHNKEVKNFIPSNNYLRKKEELNKAYTKAVNITTHNLYNFIKILTTQHGVVTIEDLNVAGMKMSKKLAKSLHRAGFGRFKELLKAKALERGVELIVADRFYPSTQRCSKCGHVRTGEDKLGLSGDKYGNSHQEYKCLNQECQAYMDRDENAVLNLVDFSEELMKEIRKLYYKKETKETLDREKSKRDKRREKQRSRRLRKSSGSDKNKQ